MRRPGSFRPAELSSWPSAAVLLATIVLFNSCAASRAGISVAQVEKEGREAASGLSDRDRALEALKHAIEAQIASAERNRLQEESRIRFAAPYFYKRFELYPTGADEPEFWIKETGSTLAPYEATVSVRNKARFTTKYHTSRSACAGDKEFICDIGTQTDTYVYENEEWTLIYSLFEVERTTVRRGDTVEEVTGKVERIAKDGSESFFGRVSGFFRGML